jgi:hypothetical protein
MVNWVSNLPQNPPFPLLVEQPHLKTVVKCFRPFDYATILAIGSGFPTALYVWERLDQTVHPRLIPRIMAIQIPFFIGGGFLVACQNTLFRLWGWRENGREQKLLEGHTPRKATNWGDQDW